MILGLGVSLPRSKNEKSITSSTLVTPVRQTCPTVDKRVCCEKLAAAWSLTASVVNYLYFALTAGVVNGDGYCHKIVDRVFCVLYLKYTAKSIFYHCGDGDRHVGIYTSPDNWRTCFLSTHADRHVVDLSVTVCFFVCFFVRRILVTDISGAGWRRAMKFCRVVDIGVR